MATRFPRDCWTKKCPHFTFWDLSVDDLTCHCDLLKCQIDACDEDFVFRPCPLEDKKDDKSTENV